MVHVNIVLLCDRVGSVVAVSSPRLYILAARNCEESHIETIFVLAESFAGHPEHTQAHGERQHYRYEFHRLPLPRRAGFSLKATAS